MSTKIDPEQLPVAITELRDSILGLPDLQRAHLTPKMDAVVDDVKRRRRIMQLIQDALGQLRLDMKYLMFDLEATRRERDEYKTKLEM